MSLGVGVSTRETASASELSVCVLNCQDIMVRGEWGRLAAFIATDKVYQFGKLLLLFLLVA